MPVIDIKKKVKKKIKVKIFDFGNIRVEHLDLNSGRDRQKLSYILNYERHKLRSKDRACFESLLEANASTVRRPF